MVQGGGLETLKKPSQVKLMTDSVYVGKGISEWLPKWKANGWRRKEKNKLVFVSYGSRELGGDNHWALCAAAHLAAVVVCLLHSVMVDPDEYGSEEWIARSRGNDDEAIALMAEHPELMQRPVVVRGDRQPRRLPDGRAFRGALAGRDLSGE